MALDNMTIERQLIETWFYLHHSALLGHELSLTHDINGKVLRPEDTYRYDVNESGLRLTVNGELGADHIKLLRLISSKSLKVLAQIGGINAILPDCWLAARQHAAL